MSLNHITIAGRLTRDVELRTTQQSVFVASLTLAVDRDFGDGCDFINVTAWKSTAEFAQKYFSKGDMMIVSGRLQIRDWTDKNNNKRQSAEVVADRIYFGGSKKSSKEESAPPVSAEETSFANDGKDDELPF